MRVRLRTEAIAREVRRERLRLVKDSPKPHVINVDAVLVLGQPREFTWGGVGYRAPPLSYQEGVRLLTQMHVLEELTESKADERTIDKAVRVSAFTVSRIVAPRSRVVRLLPWRFAFRRTKADALLMLLRWLVSVPDAATYEPPKKQETHDYADALFAFARAFPALMKDGFPISWAHYLYGNRHLGRAQAREDLRAAAAHRVSQADEKGWSGFTSELTNAAGW